MSFNGKKFHITLILLLSVLVFLSAGRVLEFGFWKDDWGAYWGARTFFRDYYLYWFHPGTTIQFTILSFLLPPNSWPWQFVGLLWKVFASWGVFLMIGTLTEQKRTGIIASILFAVSQFGLDAMGWPSATVVLIDVFFLTVATSLWIKVLRDGMYSGSKQPYYWLVGALLVDPFRTSPIIFILSIFIVFYNQQFLKKCLAVLKKYILIIPIVFVGISLWGITIIRQTVIYKFIALHGMHVGSYLSHFYVINNFFSTMTNIVVGVMIQVPENLSTGVYDRLGARLGFVFVVICVVSAVYMLKKKRSHSQAFFIVLSWLLLFYIPNHMVEPRLTMGATHRYVVIASVGWIGMISIVILNIRSNRMIVFILLCIGLISIMGTNSRITEWNTFRSRASLNRIWKTIDSELPNDNEPFIVSIRGFYPLVLNNINYSGFAPLLDYRLYMYPAIFPITFINPQDALVYLCSITTRRITAKQVITQKPLGIHAIYAWTIDNQGTISSTTTEFRAEIRQIAKRQGCQLSE